MKAIAGSARVRRPGPGTIAILLLAFAWGLYMHQVGWAQSSHFAQTRALYNGQAEIDPWHWEGMDKAWVDGHFYSVKAPGLAFASLPAYAFVRAVDGERAAHRAALNARKSPEPRWTPRAGARTAAEFGFDSERLARVIDRIENYTPVVWFLGLFTAVLPATLLLLCVRWMADRLVPGYGTLAAVTLGLCTILMTFAAEYASHALSATLGFAAFALLFRERDEWRGSEGEGRLLWVGLAGLLAGLAITTEYPLGLVGVVLFFYALGERGRARRGLAYAAGGVLGALPLFAFNLWSLGSPTEFAYSAAVEVQGVTGHDMLGLNDAGFFGITFPKPAAALDLLFASRGLLALTPVLVAAVAGLFVMRRSGRRAELWVIVAIAVVYFVYNMGYWLPFGGGTPGPRFLIPALPFLAIGLAYAYRRLAALTIALAIPSAVMMLLASLTYPLIGDNGTGMWVEMLYDRVLEHTVLTAFGVGDPLLAALPIVLAVVAAAVLAVRAAPPLVLDSIGWAAVAVLVWMPLSVLAPSVVGDPVPPLDRTSIIKVVLVAGFTSLLTLGAIALRQRVAAPASAAVAAASGSERIS